MSYYLPPTTKTQIAQIVMGSRPKSIYDDLNHLQGLLKDAKQYTSDDKLSLNDVQEVRLLASVVAEKRPSGELRGHENTEKPIAYIIGNLLDADKATFTVMTIGFTGGGAIRYNYFTGIENAQDYVTQWAKRKFRIILD